MNMKIFKYFIGLSLLCFSFSSCTLFGLDFQNDEDYESKKVDNKINMTVWEFIQSRPDIFSTLIEGIEYAGIEDLYKEYGNTHILLTNDALSSGSNCFWRKNPVILPGTTKAVTATAWDQYDKKVVKELLAYHIIKGEWSYFNLDSSDRWIETYGEGKFSYDKDGQTQKGDTAVICIKVGYDRNLPLQLNNFEWNIRGLLAASSGSCRTTNIHARDGYIHVSDWWQPRPTRYFMGEE
jgi:nuclear transport factor 2 (NTF2) superfamily protein